MSVFLSQNIKIAYQVYGTGKPIVLVHGFSSSGTINWLDTGWVETLNGAGFSCIVPDMRGHGNSEKLYDPDLYHPRSMAEDVARLIIHLGHQNLPVMGYSMGTRICAFLALAHPELVSSIIFGGLGINLLGGLTGTNEIIDALLAPSLADVSDPVGRNFRLFAEQTHSDLRALAACLKSSRTRISKEDVGNIAVPAFVAVGGDDEIGGSPSELAEILPRGEWLTIKNRDHMRATGDKNFKSGVLDFLARHAN